MVATKILHIVALAVLCCETAVRAQSATAGLQSFVSADQTIEQQKLTNARNTWNSRFFSNYNYHFTQACPTCYLGNYPWRVNVSPGQPAQAVNVKDGVAIGALSIAQVFDKLQGHLDNASDKIEAVYDATSGYPTRYKIQQGSIQSDIITSSISGFATEAGSQQEIYQFNRNKWEGSRITNYDFQYWDLGPNPSSWQYPFYVKVRNGSPVETKDNNGNLVNPERLIPMTFNQYFDMINRQLQKNAAYMDNSYDQYRGFADDIFIVTTDVGTLEFKFANYRETNLS